MDHGLSWFVITNSWTRYCHFAISTSRAVFTLWYQVEILEFFMPDPRPEPCRNGTWNLYRPIQTYTQSPLLRVVFVFRVNLFYAWKLTLVIYILLRRQTLYDWLLMFYWAQPAVAWKHSSKFSGFCTSPSVRTPTFYGIRQDAGKGPQEYVCWPMFLPSVHQPMTYSIHKSNSWQFASEKPRPHLVPHALSLDPTFSCTPLDRVCNGIWSRG